MKTRLPIIQALVVALILIGCTEPAQKTAYNTIYSLESSTTAAYSGYIDAVIKGIVSTNSVPAVRKAFDNFQAAATTATDAANFNTNALAPPNLVTLAADVVNEINVAKGH